MSNRRTTRAARRLKLVRGTDSECTKCGSTDVEVRTYPAERTELHICRSCRFPRRIKAQP